MNKSGSLTPNDLRNQVFERKMRGFDPDVVTAVLEEAASQWERLLAENLHTTEKCATLEQQMKKYADLEQTIRDTLVLARKAAEDEAQTAKKEARLIVERAHLEADSIIKQAHARTEDFRRQIEQLQTTRDRLKAEMKGLLYSYTEQIKKLDDAQIEVFPEVLDVEQPLDNVSPAVEHSPVMDFPDSSLNPAFDKAVEAGDDLFSAEDPQERPDTSDAFDAALNKIFGRESRDGSADKTGSERA